MARKMGPGSNDELQLLTQLHVARSYLETDAVPFMLPRCTLRLLLLT